jgi:hypothetical protein
MFAPNKVDGSFHTNPEFTKLYFAYGSNKNWFEIDNFLTKEEYGQMGCGCRTNTEILQTLVEFKVSSIGISNLTAFIIFKDNGIKVINCVRHDECPKNAVLIPSFYLDPEMPELIPDESAIGVKDAPITVIVPANDNIHDNVSVITNVIDSSIAGDNVAILVPDSVSDSAPESISENVAETVVEKSDCVALVDLIAQPLQEKLPQASAEKSPISIPYDEFIDLILSRDGKKKSTISKIDNLAKRNGFDDLTILKHLLLNEKSAENDGKIKKIFQKRNRTKVSKRYDLPITEFENYHEGYLFTMLNDRFQACAFPDLSASKHTIMSDIIDVIRETKPDGEVIEKLIDDIVKRTSSNKSKIIFHLMAAIGPLYA